MQELFVADLDMTVDSSDESYADRPATTMRVPFPTHVGFSDNRGSATGLNEDSVQLVRSNEALKVQPSSRTCPLRAADFHLSIPLSASVIGIVQASCHSGAAMGTDLTLVECRQS